MNGECAGWSQEFWREREKEAGDDESALEGPFRLGHAPILHFFPALSIDSSERHFGLGLKVGVEWSGVELGPFYLLHLSTLDQRDRRAPTTAYLLCSLRDWWPHTSSPIHYPSLSPVAERCIHSPRERRGLVPAWLVGRTWHSFCSCLSYLHPYITGVINTILPSRTIRPCQAVNHSLRHDSLGREMHD